MKEMLHWLDKRVQLTPESLAVETVSGEVITYRELREKAQDFAGKIKVHYSKKLTGQVAILAENSLDMVVAILGCTYLDCPLVLLNTKLSKKEWQYQVEDADVSLVICDSIYEEAVAEVTSDKVAVVCTSEIEKLSVVKTQFKTHIELSDVATLMYTSGTTGKAKAVEQSFENHWWSAISSALNLGIDTKDKWLVSLPLYHISGLSSLFKSLIYGMPILLMEKFDATFVHNAIMTKEVSIISVVSLTCKRLLEELGDDNYPSTFRCMLLGGGPAPLSLLEEAKEKQVPIFQTYGMTETCSQISTLAPTDAMDKIGSAGKPLFPAELEIRGKDGVLEPLTVGEIVVKGPMVALGYHNNSIATKESFRSNWLYTGDLGYVDNDGFLYVVDRRKDLIVSGGENVYPAEIENILLTHPLIKEAGVTGVPDEKWGSVPVAFVVSSQAINKKELEKFCKEKLATFKTPKDFCFVEALPRNATNKLVRHRLQELYLER
ncbi:o-succinylbenzoate--CoA ligase [Saliterribacillus persicus]|uniref:2-succinylbenzoate--CoA ligase n=1 Tax=Saliterribacillus persicus TaxID=930114 RepID=A0A368XIS4_9BACI|nr:o-succinylbenzoate--CoA ligase [Saliterribacillus persicus]RCW66918.1 2-succinylbenzoyl-CoA synthetase [Saliterribacillus persicus]